MTSSLTVVVSDIILRRAMGRRGTTVLYGTIDPLANVVLVQNDRPQDGLATVALLRPRLIDFDHGIRIRDGRMTAFLLLPPKLPSPKVVCLLSFERPSGQRAPVTFVDLHRTGGEVDLASPEPEDAVSP